MSIVSISELYSYFETGDFPTAQQFKNLIDTLNSGQGTLTSASGITAFAAGGQLNATPLTKNINRVDNVGATGASVKPSISAIVTFQQTVQNNGANDMNYYPFLGNNFLGLAPNAPISISPGNQVSVFCYDDGVLTFI